MRKTAAPLSAPARKQPLRGTRSQAQLAENPENCALRGVCPSSVLLQPTLERQFTMSDTFAPSADNGMSVILRDAVVTGSAKEKPRRVMVGNPGLSIFSS